MEQQKSNIVNKVAESGLIVLNPIDFVPNKASIVEIDIKKFLLHGLILREKEFRQIVKNMDINPYKDKIAAIYCSAETTLPMWAPMLLSVRLMSVAENVRFGRAEDVLKDIAVNNIRQMDTEPYKDERVVLKGCFNEEIKEIMYIELAKKLFPVVKSLMYGEPCSTVPIYKRK